MAAEEIEDEKQNAIDLWPEAINVLKKEVDNVFEWDTRGMPAIQPNSNNASDAQTKLATQERKKITRIPKTTAALTCSFLCLDVSRLEWKEVASKGPQVKSLLPRPHPIPSSSRQMLHQANTNNQLKTNEFVFFFFVHRTE